MRDYLDWPREVSIETYAKCNAACVFCPYTQMERQGERMPDEILDRIIEELKDHPHPFIIAPFKVNEPFLDKRLIPFCQKVNAELPNAFLRIFSNGQALTNKNIVDVAHLERVAHLWISLNSHDPAEYRATMGLDFEKTAKSLDELHTAVQFGIFSHDVVLSRVHQDHIAREPFVDYCSERWPLFKVVTLKRDSWLGDIEGMDRPIPDAPCGRWYELSITATGEVSRCCMDGQCKHPIGDLRTQSLFEVYNGKQWRKQRLTEMSRKETGTVCAGCNY